MSNKYWFCIIGPVTKEEYSNAPHGADFPPRMAARGAILNMLGVDPACASGWISQGEFNKIANARYNLDKKHKSTPKHQSS